ncbi:Fibrinogen C domain-containing protein 1 [Branchiostoma belcheri]|nr:Fibrinogen C domain-containing protein 1 [Branchiostoma belcheri]
MALPFQCLLVFLVTSCVSLCSAQSVCRPPSDEKCVCSPVVNCGDESALKAELEQMKVSMDRLSEKILVADCPKANANDTDSDKPQDCQDILDNDETTPSGVYMVYPRDNLGGFLVFCDMDTDGGGWTFWLGNDNLYRLAVQKVYQLRVDMEDVEGETAYAAYDTFAISPESQNYRLHIGNYSGTAGDSLTKHNGEQFSTRDRDNDDSASGSCARAAKGAWWFYNCLRSNLNGQYHLGTHESLGDGVHWVAWKGGNNSLKSTEMKIRPAP